MKRPTIKRGALRTGIFAAVSGAGLWGAGFGLFAHRPIVAGIGAVVAAVGAALILTSPADSQTPDLNAINRQINEHTQAASRGLQWSEEGRPAYDCKGFVYLKIKALEAAGVSPLRLVVLIVPSHPGQLHAVLLVRDGLSTDAGAPLRGSVMDSLSPWLWAPRDYAVSGAWSSDWLVSAIEHDRPQAAQ